MKLTRTPFVPSRNSRHRIAAIALYRALIKAARAVPITTAGASTSQSASSSLTTQGRSSTSHPVARLVRRRFDGNKLDTSPRLVFYSMAAGYRFLTLLSKARTPKSPEHDRILDLLHKRELAAARTRAAQPPRPNPPEEESQEKKESSTRRRHPILTNTAAPGEPPQFVGHPRPQSEFPGKPRRIPSLAAVSEGFPFLRYTKPQPEALTRLISRKRSRWIKTMDGLLHAEEKAAPLAALEDQWEDLVMRQMERERGAKDSAPAERKPKDHSETYLYTTVMSRLWYEYRLDKMWEEWNARGKALYDLLKAERALAEEEGTVPREQRLGSAPTLTETDAAANSSGKPARGSVTEVNRALPCVEDGMRLTKEFAGTPSMYDKTHDPFSTPIWEGIVRLQRRRLVKWMGLTTHWNQAYVENPGTERSPSNNYQRRKHQRGPREDRR